MNIKKINELVSASILNKSQIAEKCNVSRTTLDNLLAGADVKVSTVEALARTLNVPVGLLFSDDNESLNENETVNVLKQEIDRLRTLLDTKQNVATKVVVEFDVDSDEFIKLGLKDKVAKVLNKKYLI